MGVVRVLGPKLSITDRTEDAENSAIPVFTHRYARNSSRSRLYSLPNTPKKSHVFACIHSRDVT